MGKTNSSAAILSDDIQALACRGFCMFPCKPRSKSPAISGWPERATRNLAQLESWAADFHDCNWAITTGRDSGFFALDVDAKPPRNGKPSPDGQIAITEWSTQHPETPDWLRTAAIRTAHGTQYFFLYPADREIQSSASTLAPGVDVRGWHGYIMAPSSIHPDGPVYAWANDEAIVPAPAWLLDKISGMGARSAASEGPTNDDCPLEARIKEGNRNSMLASLAGSMRRRGIGQAAIEAALLVINREQCEVPLSDAEVKMIARSVSRYAPSMRCASKPAPSHALHISRPEEIPDPRSLLREPVRFLVDGLIPRDGVTIIAGEYSVGKSWFALSLASQLKHGGSFIGRDVIRCTEITYFDRENPLPVIQERMDTLYCEGDPAHRHWGMWCDDEPPLLDHSLLLTFAHPGAVLIFDSLVRFHRQDENSPTQMAQVMACLRRMQSRGAAVIALHHRDKRLEAGYRGTAEIAAGADVVYSLSREEGDSLVLRAVKNRVQVDPVVSFRAEWDEARLVPCDLSSVLEKRALVDNIREQIQRNPGISQSGIAKAINTTLVRKASRWRVQRVLDQHEGSLWRAERGPMGTKTAYFDVFTGHKKLLVDGGSGPSGQQVGGDRPAEPADLLTAGSKAKGATTCEQPAEAADASQQVLPPRPAGLLPPCKGGTQRVGPTGNTSKSLSGTDGDGEGGLA